MTDHYLGINRGKPGFTDSDFVYGTSTGSTDIELRIADGVVWTRLEVELALDAFKRFLLNSNVHIPGTQFPVGT